MKTTRLITGAVGLTLFCFAASGCGRSGTLSFDPLGSEAAGLRTLAESSATLQPAAVASQLRGLNMTEQRTIGALSGLSLHLLVRGCRDDASLEVLTANNTYTCDGAAAALAYAARFSGNDRVDIHVERQRRQLLSLLKCSSGEVSATVCGSYSDAVTAIEKGQLTTARLILAKLAGGECLAGVDPGCQQSR